MSRNIRPILLAAIIASSAWSNVAQAQRAPPQFPDMTFFITSKSGPDGANFGGIDGADNHCKALAKRGVRISAPRRWAENRQSMHAIALATVRG